MIPLPPRSTPTDTRFPYTTLVRSLVQIGAAALVGARRADRLFQFIDGHHAQRGMADLRAVEDRDGEEGGAEALLHDGADHRMRSEEHTSELQSLMRISYSVFCLQNKKT